MTIASRITVSSIAVGLLVAGCGGTSAAPSAPLSTAAVTSTSAAVSSAAVTSATSTADSSADSSDSSWRKPPGWKLVVDQANGYQVGLPPGYSRITSKAQLAKVAKAGAAAISRAGIAQQLINRRLKMIAISPVTGDAINVVVAPADGLTADELPQVEPLIKKEVAQLGAKKVTFKEVTFGGEPALRAAYSASVGDRHVPTVQYLAVHGKQAFTLTLSEPLTIPSKIEQQTVASWRFL